MTVKLLCMCGSIEWSHVNTGGAVKLLRPIGWLTGFAAIVISMGAATPVASESTAAPPDICAMCEEADNPWGGEGKVHKFMDVGEWVKGGNFHSGWGIGYCTMVGQHQTCDEGDVPTCDPSCFTALESAVETENVAELSELLARFPNRIRLNEKRVAVQVTACDGSVVASLQLRETVAKSLLAGA